MKTQSLVLNSLFSIILFCLSSAPAHAQTQETLGIATFTPPTGWARIPNNATITFSKVNGTTKTWCQIGVTTTQNSKGDLGKDFNAEWNTFAISQRGASGPFNLKDQKLPGGAEARTGSGKFDFNGSPSVIEITTYRLGDYEFSLIVMSNNLPEYQAGVDILRRSLTVSSPDSSMPATTPKAVSGPNSSGFAFTTTNFDDGWTSVEEKDWVRVTKGNITVLIHYPVAEDSQYFPQSQDETLFFWNKLVAPRYSNLRNFINLYNSGFEPAHLASATVRDAGTGRDVYVALFKKKGTYWMEIITPNKATFVQNFSKDIDSVGVYETDWTSLTRLFYYNRFAVGASDLKGKWTSDFSGLTQYVNSNTGLSAGTDTHTSRETFVFGSGSSYSWELGVASGYVGSIRFQSAKSAGKFSVPSNWQVNFSDIERKPKIYNAYFSSIRGGRILWLDGAGFGKSQ